MKIKARILSLDWTHPPKCRVVLSRKSGNVIYAQIFKVKASDLPLKVLTGRSSNVQAW